MQLLLYLVIYKMQVSGYRHFRVKKKTYQATQN